MKILFNLVLLFSSKKFIRFYRDIKNSATLNEAALVSYFGMFLFKVVFWIGLFSFFILNFWEPESSDLVFNALSLGAFLLNLLIIFLILQSQVRNIEVLARAYSDGILVAGLIKEQSYSGGKYTYRFRYSVEGRYYDFEKTIGLFGGGDKFGSEGRTCPLICSQSDPNIVEIYDKNVFSKRCLIKGKEPPKNHEEAKAEKHIAR